MAKSKLQPETKPSCSGFKEYAFEDRKDPQLGFVTVFARRPYLDIANKFPEGDADIPDLGVSRVILGVVVPEAAIDFSEPKVAELEFTEVDDGTFIMATIDNGMAIAHNLFRNPDTQVVLNQTRVQRFWNMGGKPVAGRAASTGRIWDKVEIDVKLSNHLHFGLLDEEEFYRCIGLIDWSKSGFKPAALRVSHSTHVMGLAGGFEHPKERRPLFAVQLPTDAITDVTGHRLTVPLGLAVQFLKNSLNRYRVGSKPRRPPMVVNFSFGNFAGPHDSTGVVEWMIDHQMASTTDIPPSTTLPAGNLSRCHARIYLSAASKSTTLDWRVQPIDRSPSDLQFWLPEMAFVPLDCLTLTVAAPGDALPEAVSCILAPSRLLKTVAGEVVGALS